VEFRAADLAHARRKALDFWYNNRHTLGLTRRDFFAQRELRKGNTIVFAPAAGRAASAGM
jgi:hypothetical protein